MTCNFSALNPMVSTESSQNNSVTLTDFQQLLQVFTALGRLCVGTRMRLSAVCSVSEFGADITSLPAESLLEKSQRAPSQCKLLQHSFLAWSWMNICFDYYLLKGSSCFRLPWLAKLTHSSLLLGFWVMRMMCVSVTLSLCFPLLLKYWRLCIKKHHCPIILYTGFYFYFLFKAQMRSQFIMTSSAPLSK